MAPYKCYQSVSAVSTDYERLVPAHCSLDLLRESRINTGMGEVTRYTLAEVATRNGKNNAPVWIIYKDSVYDVTKYIPEHPAGDVITEEGGKDVTKDYDDAGHSSDAMVIMKKYKIGEIVEEEKKYDANGKKKKRVVPAPPEGKYNRSCINVVTCGLLG